MIASYDIVTIGWSKKATPVHIFVCILEMHWLNIINFLANLSSSYCRRL